MLTALLEREKVNLWLEEWMLQSSPPMAKRQPISRKQNSRWENAYIRTVYKVIESKMKLDTCKKNPEIPKQIAR